MIETYAPRPYEPRHRADVEPDSAPEVEHSFGFDTGYCPYCNPDIYALFKSRHRSDDFSGDVCPYEGATLVDDGVNCGERQYRCQSTERHRWTQSKLKVMARRIGEEKKNLRSKPTSQNTISKQETVEYSIGSRWVWEKDKPWAREEIEIREIQVTSDGEVWIESVNLKNYDSYWNTKERFAEACTPLVEKST